MDKIAKAIGAAQGGATSAATVIATAAVFMQFLPPTVVVPWWGYIIFVVLAIIFCMLPPFIGAYLAPANSPPVAGSTVAATIPAKVVPVPSPASVDLTGNPPFASGGIIQPGSGPAAGG